MNTTFFIICGIAFIFIGIIYVGTLLNPSRSRKIDPYELRHFK
jgi:hypothetical protein